MNVEVGRAPVMGKSEGGAGVVRRFLALSLIVSALAGWCGGQIVDLVAAGHTELKLKVAFEFFEKLGAPSGSPRPRRPGASPRRSSACSSSSAATAIRRRFPPA